MHRLLSAVVVVVAIAAVVVVVAAIAAVVNVVADAVEARLCVATSQ